MQEETEAQEGKTFVRSHRTGDFPPYIWGKLGLVCQKFRKFY